MHIGGGDTVRTTARWQQEQLRGMIMRTIDTEAVITDQHTLIVSVPTDVRPGSYRVVVVIEAPAVDEAMPAESMDTVDAWSALRQVGQELA